MHSEAFRAAMARGTRYTCLTGLDVQMLVDTVARVDYAGVTRLGNRLVELLQAADEIRITSANGMDISAKWGDRPIHLRGIPADKPGDVGDAGRADLVQPVGGDPERHHRVRRRRLAAGRERLIANPITLTVENGVVTDIAGDGSDAAIYRNWMASHGDPNMYRVAHWSLGFNPGVTRSTGRIVEDERCSAASSSASAPRAPGSAATRGWPRRTPTVEPAAVHPTMTGSRSRRTASTCIPTWSQSAATSA